MNPYNLIDPISPQEQMSWRRWKIVSLGVFSLVAAILSGYTIKLCYDIYALQKKMALFHASGVTQALGDYERLSVQCLTLKQEIKIIKLWQQSTFFYRHITLIAEKIPSTILLLSLDFDRENATLEGQTQSIENVLGFIHDLNETELFQGMILVELKPTPLLFEEKKLVNFLIKGKLKGL